jgi:glutathione S-transferase
MTLKLVIGNKNYSSWSMRPWLALRANDIAFEEVFIPLYTGEADKQRILDVTPSGKVPALVDGGFQKRGCGHRTAPPVPMRVRFRRRCIQASSRCATNAA